MLTLHVIAAAANLFESHAKFLRGYNLLKKNVEPERCLCLEIMGKMNRDGDNCTTATNGQSP